MATDDSCSHRSDQLGNPSEFHIVDLAKMVIEPLTGSKSPLVFQPLPHDDPKQRKPDITLA